MIPLTVKEMREASSTDVYELVENSRNNSLFLNLKVEAGLARQSQDFLHHELSRLFEDRVDDGVNQSGVALAVVLLHQDLVLHVEVTHVVVKVNVFRNHKTSHTGVLNSSCEGDPGRVRVA